MAEIEEISADDSLAPEDYDARFDELEDRINDEFREGKIEDLHFLMLQELIATRRSEIRKAEVTQKFEMLPEGIMLELDEMLQDGKISRDEYEGFVTTISKTKTLTEAEKKELSNMIERWKLEDKDSLEQGEKSLEPEAEIEEELGEELKGKGEGKKIVEEEHPEPREENKELEESPEPTEETKEEEKTPAKKEKKKKWGKKEK
jgi:hypothetical protein